MGVSWRGDVSVKFQKPDLTHITAGAEKALKSLAGKGDEPKMSPPPAETTPKASEPKPEPKAAEPKAEPPPAEKPAESAPTPKPEQKQAAEPQTPPPAIPAQAESQNARMVVPRCTTIFYRDSVTGKAGFYSPCRDK